MEGEEEEEEEETRGQLEVPLLLPVGPDDEYDHYHETSGTEVAWRNRTLIATFALVDFTTNLAVSVIFPFLPQALEEAGAGPYQRGLVFAALPLGVLLVSPLVPPLLWRLGPVPILTGSLSLLTACLVACALWAGPGDERSVCSSSGGTENATVAAAGGAAACGEASDDAMHSVVAWVIARLVMGFGTACTSVTSLCLVTRHMSQSLSFANGVLESAIGKGIRYNLIS